MGVPRPGPDVSHHCCSHLPGLRLDHSEQGEDVVRCVLDWLLDLYVKVEIEVGL